MTFNAAPPPWKSLTHWIPGFHWPSLLCPQTNITIELKFGDGVEGGAYIPVKGLAKLYMWICTVSALNFLPQSNCPIFTSTNAHLNHFVRYNSLCYSLNYLVLHSLMCSPNAYKWAADLESCYMYLIGLGRLSKYFCLLFYSFILSALAYYSFTVTYYSHFAYRKNEGCGQNNTNNYTN